MDTATPLFDTLAFLDFELTLARRELLRDGAPVAIGGRALELLALLASRRIDVAQAGVLVLGVTFKENCPDLRNSRALALALRLAQGGARVEACDPWADADEVARQGVALCAAPRAGGYDAVVLAVAHEAWRTYDATQVRALGRPGAVVYDVKSVWPREAVDDRL